MYDSLSIVVPYRVHDNPYREKIAEWMLARYRALFPESELILADDGSKVFNRSKSKNLGVEKATRDVVLIGDADTIPYRQFVGTGIKWLLDGASWVLPYDEGAYYMSDEPGAEHILSLDPTTKILPKDITFSQSITCRSGQVMLTKASYEAVGGFDGRFEGWGYEDNAFELACNTILGHVNRLQGAWTIHIWHPFTHESTFGQPHIDSNRGLYGEYLIAAHSKEQMEAYVAGHP